ncbi:hypothetical protein OSTOST_04193 [Ostertagia ostertagi]
MFVCIGFVEDSSNLSLDIYDPALENGNQTYLAVVEWDGLHEQHCLIAPTEHVCSSIQLDENVWDEMRIWRKEARV